MDSGDYKFLHTLPPGASIARFSDGLLVTVPGQSPYLLKADGTIEAAVILSTAAAPRNNPDGSRNVAGDVETAITLGEKSDVRL